ncbi:MAG TPA: carboxypeptidase-like regulatory domain-containing protein [Candidatus Polarisedimenticolia bacterium]|nr:carboxypeptidase-like regulatory domain-containing protein [Candidatus Polarisedimenticolia bacterium]
MTSRILSAALLLSSLIAGMQPAAPLAVTSGALRIQVSLPQNAGPVEGAAILVIDPQLTTFRREARTDQSGRAEIMDLAPKEYYLRVEKELFQSYEGSFETQPGQTTQRRVVLARFGLPPPDAPDPKARRGQTPRPAR